MKLKPGIWPLIELSIWCPEAFLASLSGSFRESSVPRGDLHQSSESGRHGGCTDDRAGSHQPFPASIHLQIQAFQSARTGQLEIACLGENNFVHRLGLIHHKHGLAN